MKKRICQIAVIAFAIIGCQKTEIGNYEKITVASNFRGEVEGLLETKTTLDKNNNVRWSEGDQVIIFNGSTLGGKYQITEDSVGETSAGFEYIEDAVGGFVSGSDIDHNIAFYPFSSKVKCAKGDDKEPTESYELTKISIPSVQQYCEDSFGQETFPMVAVTSSVSDYRLTFKNVFGGMKLQLKGDCVVSSITVTGFSSEPLAGTASVKAFVDGSAPTVSIVADASTSVTLDCGEQGVELNEDVATNFIIALPPTVFTSGFSVSIVDKEGRLMIIKTSKENKIYRSSLLKMPEITVDASKTASIELPETETVVSSAAGSFDVEVNANVDYEVIMPDVDWLHQETSSKASCETFSVDENTEYDSRSAEIVFKSKVHDQQRTFTVTQLQKDAIVLAKEEYEIDVKGGTLAIDLQSNVDFEVSVASDAQSWLSYVSTRALESKVLTFSVASCADDVDRTGVVTLTKDGISQTIKVHQYSMISKEPIVFADANVKKACVAAFDTDGDGEVSYKEAAAAKSLSGVFDLYRVITSFDEFQYFTSITSIPSNLFKDCTILKSITFPESLCSIGTEAFSGCTNLQKIHVTKNVYSIGGMAFYKCTSLSSLTFDDDISSLSFGSIASNYDTSTAVNYTGYIGPFESCTSLTEVRIPAAVSHLGSGVFANCTSLKKVSFQEGSKLKSLYGTDWNATQGPFGNCSSLEQIILPETVTNIGYRAFYGCSSLLTINVPEDVSAIGDYAFYGCKKLDGVELPELCRSIGERAFYGCSSLTKMHLPDNCTVVGESAFEGCKSLEDVKLSFAQTEIRSSVFWGCSALKQIELPEYLATIGSYAFYGCVSLTGITIPDSVTALGYRAFYDCSGLASITLGSGITSIGDYAFYGCVSLTGITLPDSVTSLGIQVFSNCSDLVSVTLSSGITSIGDSAFRNCTSLTGITIPDSVTSIGSYAFSGCSGLESVTLGSGITSIGDYAFRNCTSLAGITIPDSVTSVGSYAFNGCSGLKSVTLGSGISSIEDSAFRNCTSLAGITIPDSVRSLGDNAFYECSGLVSVTLGSRITSIGEFAFYGCSCLSEIAIPDEVVTIGNSAFAGCNGLTKAVLGQGVVTIGNHAFRGSALTSIVVPDKVTTIGNNTFAGCLKLRSVTLGTSLAAIDNETFAGCSSLTDVTIPLNVTSIGSHAFSYCSSLTDVTIPDNVTVIGNYAFEYCSGLHKISLGTGLLSVGPCAFYSCTNLENVVIPDKVTKIGNYAFYNCLSMTNLTLGASIISIEHRAFDRCSNLAEVISLSAVPPTLGSGAFNSNKSGRIIYVPGPSLDNYKASWIDYASSIQAMAN